MVSIHTNIIVESISDLFKNALEITIEKRLKEDLEPMRKELIKKAESIIDEEVAKFSVNIFKNLTMEKIGQELIIRVVREQK